MTTCYDKTSKFELIEKLGFKEHFKADKWEDYNKAFFNGLAPKYDALNEVLSLGQHTPIKKKAIERCNIKDGDTILDICTGTGDIAIYIAKKYPNSKVIAIDVSDVMLDIARKRAEGIPNISFQNADAMQLPFEKGSFDLAIISFGLRNLLDLEAGLLEMQRVTKAGGKVMNLDLGKPKGKLLNWIYRLHFLTIIPFLGKTIFHRGEFNSFAYLPNSGNYFPSQETLVEIFSKLGFNEVKNYNYMLGSIAQQIAVV